jgi:FO synthase
VDQHGGPVTVAEPPVAPANQGDEGRGQFGARRGEDVVVPRRMILVALSLEDAGGHQLLQAVGQDRARHAEVVLQGVEASDPAEDVAHDQHRPPVTDDRSDGFDAGSRLDRFGRHPSDPSSEFVINTHSRYRAWMPHPDDAELLATPLEELMAAAGRTRDERTGTRITYSPKVFIPLTFLCNDTCGYCTFAQPPGRVAEAYLGPDEVRAIARAGARAGCHEALFTLGERPEDRYEVARDWLAAHGYATTVDYLAAMCAMVVEETGLLPHANAGALSSDELAQLRPVSVSQGMMIESVRGDLACHRGAPDKDPARRLATLEAAGELQIPFTTGLLVGIGDERQDRLEGLRAIAASHERHGHVQEVIIQNFLPKLLTGMRNAPACPPDEYLWTIAAARLVLPSSIHLQAPPNLSDDFGVLLDAGIDDWGGVSPVTADHVNPERPWPDLDRLRDVTEARGFTLAPRLTAYPEFLDDSLTGPEHWIDPALRFAVLDRSDAEALARDDPGSQFPERVQGTTETADGADVVIVGDRSTQWYSGWNANPPTLLPASSGPVRGRGRRGARRVRGRRRTRHRRDGDAVRGPRPRGRRHRRGRRSVAPRDRR